ncbi:MAG: hypothetical protein ACRETA_11075 [Gammaproteobacteria bacterium]
MSIMSGNRASLFMGLAIVLILNLAVSRPVSAMGGYTSAQVVTGTVQSIDYLHHAITVNNQVYTISPQAKFNGIGAFSVLHVGMAVQMLLADAASNSPDSQSAATESTAPEAIQVTWLPSGA